MIQRRKKLDQYKRYVKDDGFSKSYNSLIEQILMLDIFLPDDDHPEN